MLIHSITTTSECEVQECLSRHAEDHKKAFVLTTRIPNDDAHIRYDVFLVMRDENLK